MFGTVAFAERRVTQTDSSAMFAGEVIVTGSMRAAMAAANVNGWSR